jgi:GT2 family glycosyltransferase
MISTEADPSHSRQTNPSVTAVIVYFRTPGPLAACLRSLMQQTHEIGEIVVIDNSSMIDGLERPPVEPHGWQWERMPGNSGFAAACNAGAAVATSAHLLFLNADVELHPEACARLLDVMHRDPRCAVAGPRIFDTDNEVELSARAFPSVKTGLLGRSSLVTRVLRRNGILPPGVSMALTDRPRTVDWVSGACMLIRRSSFELVRGFDEGYWMYWEDADICRRMVQHALCVWYVPDAVARHRTGSSGRSARSIRAFHESAARYLDLYLAPNRAGRIAGRLILTTRCRLTLAAFRRSAASARRDR